MPITLSIVVPVFNDWTSATILLERLNKVADSLSIKISVLLVDDGSTELLERPLSHFTNLTSLAGVEIVHLALNVGHQRAIAIGLCVAVLDYDLDAVIVMDADGEDPPESIATLLEQAMPGQDYCIVAQRRKRTENLRFRLSYIAYKSIFRLVTGKEINFGNFSLTSRGYARRLVMVSDLWNNLAAAILRTRFPIKRIAIDRGKRYAGTSKMNYVSLIVHGLSGMSVYTETIFVRLLLLTIILSSLTVVSVAFVLSMRIFAPRYATPGWATTVTFGMMIILAQVFFTTLTSNLMSLNNRVQRLVIPIQEFRQYIGSRQVVAGCVPGEAIPTSSVSAEKVRI
jgi:glycosyltransferase involved in cell wall biosynthesis